MPRRKTKTKEISRESDPEKAREIARYGRTLSRIERALGTYQYFRGLAQTSAGDAKRHYLKILEECAEELCEAFLDAVDARDLKSIESIAPILRNPNWDESCNQRWEGILALKVILDKRGETMTITQLAKLVGEPKTQDGYSSLRRLAKNLRFPIKTRQGKQTS